jgi:membrane protease YdiL (CAAX protease family)
MDPDAINDAAPRGTSAGREPGRTPAQKVLNFLKTQGFYLAVVILAVIMGSLKTWKEFRAQEEQRRTGQEQENAGPPPLLQKDLDTQEKVCLTVALSRPEGRYRRAAALAEAVESLNQFLLWSGGAVALAMGLSWAVGGRIAARPALLEPPWGLWDVAKLAALWAACVQLLHTKLFFPFDPQRPFALPGDWVAEIFIGILLAGATIHIVVAERGGHLRDLGIGGKFFSGIGLGLTAFLVVQPFLQLVAVLEERAAQKGKIPDIPVQQIIQVIAKTRSGWVVALAAIVAIVVAPISEELLFRGFLQPALGHWVGRWSAIVLSAAFFAAAHMDLYAMPTLLLLGIALAYVYDRTRSLAAPVALHMAFNGITMLSVFAFRGLVIVLRAPR